MNVFIAIDSWKGCLASREANEAARRGVLARWPDADVRCVEVSDGGEGFLEAISSVLSASPEGGTDWQRITVDVLDPLMRPIKADYLYKENGRGRSFCPSGDGGMGWQITPPHGGNGGGSAIIEMAQASGLTLLGAEERNPLVASSYGTGQLIADALRRGATDIVVGLGGSATSDCGRGMLEALKGLRIENGGLRIENGGLRIATDVTNPLLGPDGATYVFAPQKGASRQMLPELEARAQAFAADSALLCGRDCSCEPGAGAAGGMGYALMQYFGARRVSGIDFLFDLAGFDDLLAKADLVVTGEGRADRQTLMGKVPTGVLRRAQAHGVSVVLVAGQVSDRDALLRAGFAQVLCVNPPESPIEECLRPEVATSRIGVTMAQLPSLPFL